MHKPTTTEDKRAEPRRTRADLVKHLRYQAAIDRASALPRSANITDQAADMLAADGARE